MSLYLGIDTSNYTTSVALYDNENKTIKQNKMLLPVKDNELGLRQSDAVFHHTKQLPIVICELFSKKQNISAIGVSTRPRNIEGSYMPCFLAGKGLAESISSINGVKVYETSHQVGHILAALYSADKLNMINERFIAFHVSGGTTDCLLVEPDENEIISAVQISTSLDLKAGQVIDRVGVMLGLKFPCGLQLEKISYTSNKIYKIKPTLKGMDCCLSGVENKCKKMLSEGEKPEDIANYCMQFIYMTIEEMTKKVIEEYGNLPIVYAGGVMSNALIRKQITAKFNASFAMPEFSCDNAAGVAIYSSLKGDLYE